MKLRDRSACQVLTQSDDTIMDIALNLDFDDQSSFTLHFRKQMGTTSLWNTVNIIKRQPIEIEKDPSDFDVDGISLKLLSGNPLAPNSMRQGLIQQSLFLGYFY